MLWLGFSARQATGTSLLAVAIVAPLAAAGHALYGTVDIGRGIVVGLPAAVGALAGTWLQQRLPTRAIALLFSLMLFALATELFLK